MKFGTDGIRGRAGVSPVDGAGAYRLGMAVGARGPVVIGRDTRPSGEDLARALIRGVVAVGGDAHDAGVLPSPALATAVAASSSAMGVMVTASHNPAEDNGFKVLWPGGHKPDDDRVAGLEQALQALQAEASPSLARGRSFDHSAKAREVYQEAFVGAVGDLTALAGRRIVVDLAHGAASSVAPRLLASLQVEAVLKAGRGGRINDGCGSEHPTALGRWVREEGADAGLALDGDGDRCLLVDASGEVIAGDAVIALLARHAAVRSLAVSVMSTSALASWLPGVSVLRTPVGDRHLAQAVRAGRAAMGGEDSGHILFGDGLVGGDGLFAGLRALHAAFTRADTLREAVADFAPWPRRLTKVPVARRPAIGEEPSLTRLSNEAVDALGEGGRLFLRYSGTEPVLRILVEGRDPDVVARVSARATRVCAEVLA